MISSRHGLVAVLLLAAVGAGCGDDGAGELEPGDVRAAADADDAVDGASDEPRAAPRWEELGGLDGDGSARERVTVADAAIQWRVRAECDGDGELEIAVRGADDDPGEALDDGDDELVATACGERGEGYASTTGEVELAVDADGPWRLEIDEQVDTPVHEPPLPEMTAQGAQVIAGGEFYEVERRAEGRVDLYELADGRLALRVEDLDTVPEPGLYVWVSGHQRPETTAAVLDAAHTEVAHVTATIGDHNYLLPADVDADDVASVVLWCEPVRIAYGAATLDT